MYEELVVRRVLLFRIPAYHIKYTEDEVFPEKISSISSDSRINQMYTSSDKDRASDLIGLIMNVQDYVFRNQDCVRKELKSMGGKVLQLESEKKYRERS